MNVLIKSFDQIGFIIVLPVSPVKPWLRLGWLSCVDPQINFSCYLNVTFQNPRKRIGMCAEVSLVFVMVTYQTWSLMQPLSLVVSLIHANSCDNTDKFRVCLVLWAFDLYVIYVHYAKLSMSHPREGHGVFLSSERFFLLSKISIILFCRKVYPVPADQKEVLFNMNTGM